MSANQNTNSEGYNVTGLLNIYRQAVKNVPFLKYGWIIIATICILALASYFQLKNSDVFLYAVAVILISFLGFLFSYLLKTEDKFVKYLLYLLITCVVITIATVVLSFGTYIIWGEPKLYSKLLPGSTEIVDSTRKDLEFTFNMLDGTWQNEWSSGNSSATETVIINEDGEYFVNGNLAFVISEFKYNKNNNLVKFIKTSVIDQRILLNTLKVENKNLLVGTEMNYNVKYTRLSN